MDWKDFAHWGAEASRWAAEYHETLRDRPVRAQVEPGEILAQLPAAPPEDAEGIEAIFDDFKRVIVPGMTHWQHPRFFAYFPANAAPVSAFAEVLVNAMAAQCMLWQTSPAATELETRMMDWLRQAIDLPSDFTGVIQDSASTATLAAVLVMRERALGFAGNKEGLPGQPRLRIYASSEVHSSVDRAVRFAGIGQDNLVRVPITGGLRGMDPEALRRMIAEDREAGFVPAGIVAAVGGTGVGATDPLEQVSAIAREEGLFLHVDAAWAGAAMICPEHRALWVGVEHADSVVFNPHKWLGAQFDCSAHYLKNPDELVRTLAMKPEYLRTVGQKGARDYSDWSIPLGRRFRALKLWFLIRAHGLSGLRQMIRDHVRWSRDLAARLGKEPGFEIVTEPVLSLFSFRFVPEGAPDPDALTLSLLEAINDDGRIYLTHTKLDGAMVLRFQAGAFTMTAEDADMAFEAIRDCAAGLGHRAEAAQPK